MNKTQYLAQMSAKEDILSPFMIKYIAIAEGKDGKSYLNLVLADNSGEMEARKWQGAELAMAKFKAGDVVAVNGKVNLFQGRLQIIVSEISKLEENQIKREDYILKAGSAPESMYSELLAIVNSLEEIYIKDLLKNILSDHEISRRLKIWSAGKSVHHAYQSGLLEHILSCTQLANQLSAHYNVNRSYVVAGCILHDLCKIYELTEGPVVEYTDEGKLVGHLVKGIELVEQFASQIKLFPPSVKQHLKHILLAHHGEYAYGSPKLPHTSEAYLVHLIDLMDSKMNSLLQVKTNDSNIGAWSGFNKHLDRIVYKNHLPTFKHYIVEEDSNVNNASQSPKSTPNTAMGQLLKGFKVDTKE